MRRSWQLLVTGAVTLGVCLLNNHFQQSKTRALLEYKLDELTERVNKHNNLIDRTYHLEEDMAVAKKKNQGRQPSDRRPGKEHRMSETAKKWWKAAGIRAVKTMAQTCLGVIGASVVLSEVDWIVVLSSAAAGDRGVPADLSGRPAGGGAGKGGRRMNQHRYPTYRPIPGGPPRTTLPGGKDHHWGLWMRPHGHGHGSGHLGRPPGHPGHGVRLGPGTRL